MITIKPPTLAEYIRAILISAGYSEHNPDRESKGFVIVPGPNRAASVSVGWTGTQREACALLLAQYANTLGQMGLDVADWGNFLIVTRKD